MRLILLALICAVATSAVAAPPPDEVITCSGIWSPGLTEATLVKQFGRGNVVRENVYVAEGAEEAGTILFPEDDRRRVEIVWRDSGRGRPHWIRIPNPSRWRASDGIRNGLTLAEVEKLNGRPFKLYGFDWDYGGTVTDWRGGRLMKTGAPCRIQLRFDRSVPERATSAQEQALDSTSGDRELLSSAASLRLFPIRVTEVVISYPD